MTVALIVFSFPLAGHEGRAPTEAVRWPADLYLGGVQTQLDPFRPGIGEDIPQ